VCSRIRSFLPTTTLLKIVFLNAQPSVFPPRVWSLPMNAVCDLLPRSVLPLGLRKHPLLGCGDVADITNNGGKTAAETDCSMACSGDPLHLCGGAERLQLYLWNGNLVNWNTPANTGRYEVRTFRSPYIHTYSLRCHCT
jgi:hypothetical protein